MVKGWFRLAKARTQLRQLPAAREAIGTALETAQQLPEGAAAAMEEMKALQAEIEAGLSQAERVDGLNEEKQS